MMVTKFQLHGASEFAANLNELSKAARKNNLYAILRPAAEPMRERAAAKVRRRSPAPDIADNIVVSLSQKTDSGRVDEFQAAVAVGPAKGFDHGRFLEFGTIYARAFPFMRPAFDGGVARAFGIIQEGIWALLRKANKAPTTSTFGSGGTL